MQRAYDQVIHDVALMKLPVVLCLDRAGLVGEDGPTHHGVFDVSFLRCIPDIQVIAPRDEIELEQMLAFAAVQSGPVAIRYPRGAGIGCKDSAQDRPEIISGQAEIVREGNDVAIWALGHMLHPALEAAQELERQGISARIINPRFIKPFDLDMLADTISKRMPMVTIEENALPGGFGSLVAEHAVEMGHSAGMLRIGIPDSFVQHGSQTELRRMLKIDAEGIKERISEWLRPSVIKKVAC
jgi:1-deoxy-D-xylulose-5-phosphate synthase